VGELTLIAFYFLLRVGEYTHHGRGIWRTQQFRLKDIKFFVDNLFIPMEQVRAYTQEINLVSLTIDNQKNGVRGQILSHHALTGNRRCCPVRAVVLRVIDLLQDGASPDTLICAFREAKSLPWQFVRDKDIVKVVKDAVLAPDLRNSRFSKEEVGSHSLRAGGAMALYINRRSALEIQRAGRWTSTTFLEYIHSQLAITSQGLAQAMSTETSFLNMA